jgi:TetR/AcrR family transcriptional regulator, tetracycline repressor protein
MAKGLTLDALVDAAFDVLDERGLDGLTVRAVAERLDVKAPALYWHVRDKQALLDEMGTRVWRDAAAAASSRRPADDWRTAFIRYGRSVRAELLRHRDGARAFSGTYLTDAGVLRDQESGLAWMESQGFTVDATIDAYSVLTSFVVGHCIEEQARSQASDDRYSLARRDERVEAETHPRVAASGRVLDEAPDARFDRMLDLVVAGVASGAPSRRSGSHPHTSA